MSPPAPRTPPLSLLCPSRLSTAGIGQCGCCPQQTPDQDNGDHKTRSHRVVRVDDAPVATCCTSPRVADTARSTISAASGHSEQRTSQTGSQILASVAALDAAVSAIPSRLQVASPGARPGAEGSPAAPRRAFLLEWCPHGVRHSPMRSWTWLGSPQPSPGRWTGLDPGGGTGCQAACVSVAGLVVRRVWSLPSVFMV
jgi:hypothetical protein